ncbi:MAG: HAD family hydrolase [Promethearchaeota archaeon]|nr:MAG: HAD family hydrolase [Candidatus Lokiarchaeota archaeon]
MIKAITFDLWNTIFTNKFYSNLRLKCLTQFLESNEIFYSSDKIDNAFKSAFYLPERYYEKNLHIYTKERISKLFHFLNLESTNLDRNLLKNKFEEVMLKEPPLLKIGLKKTLEELSSDYKIGLISNTGITPGRIIDKVFKKYEISKFFQVKIYSDEIGYYKPHPILFKTALRKLKCFPQNSIHIGDKLETDIQGAKDCNMLTIWINDSDSPKSKSIQPDYEIQQIYDAVEIIKQIV